LQEQIIMRKWPAERSTWFFPGRDKGVASPLVE
jgi:hypothetical protein